MMRRKRLGARVGKLVFAWRLPRDNRAVTSIEYGLIAVIIILALVASIPGVAPSLIHIFNQITQQL